MGTKREIRFRAWDTKQAKWLEMIPPREYMLDCDEWDHVDDEATLRYPENPLPTFGGRIVLEQYTGLKDSKGRDIYEGDILQTACSYDRYYEDRDPELDLKGVELWRVVWRSGTFGINCDEYAGIETGWGVELLKSPKEGETIGAIEGMAAKYEFSNYGGNGGVQTDFCDVIGNAHQNPELLTP